MPADLVIALTKALDDPVRTVRVGALLSLAESGKAPQGPLLDRAKAEFFNHAQINIDDAAEQFNAGKVAILLNDAPAAIRALETSLRLSGDPAVRYPLARAYLAVGRTADALPLLKQVTRQDPNYAEAQRIVRVLSANP